MRNYLLLFSLALSSLVAQVEFEDCFKSSTLRIDFTLSGNDTTSYAFLSQLIEEPYWGGRISNLDTSLRLGDYLLLAKRGEQVIYEEGFASLFEEWQVTEEAQFMSRSFPNTVLMPFPTEECDIYILKRSMGLFSDTLMHLAIDPSKALISTATLPDYEVYELSRSLPPASALDVVILAEGFTAEEMPEFRKLSKKLTKSLLRSEVFDENRQRINFYGIEAVSPDSGVDNPQKDIWVNTAFGGSFYTLYSERYLMASDVWAIRDVAALVPYDQIYIIMNTNKYGGGGIYNYYSTCSAYGRAGEEVIVHEFGHGFAALADEYFYDDNFFIDYIDKSREPWQKNITTLVDFDRKWADMLLEETPIPTPIKAQKKYPLGVYEGAAYVSKGVYRACPDCRMKTNGADDFCPVCRRAIEEVLDFITGETSE